MPPRKAPGHDGVPVDLYKALPTTLTAHLHPHTTKVVAPGAEPCQWRGIVIAPVRKKSNTPDPTGDRPEHLINTNAKIDHKHLRTYIQPTTTPHAMPLQCGGLNSKSTDFGAHLLRQTRQHSLSHRQTTATLHVDLVAAFDSHDRGTIFNLAHGRVHAHYHSLIDASYHTDKTYSTCSLLGGRRAHQHMDNLEEYNKGCRHRHFCSTRSGPEPQPGTPLQTSPLKLQLHN